MTVVLALRCADGVVLGSDSQITDSARGLSYPAQKLHPFGDTGGVGWQRLAGGAVRPRAAVRRAAPRPCSARRTSGTPCRSGSCRCCAATTTSSSREVPGEKQSGRHARPPTCWSPGTPAGSPFIVDIDPHGLIGRYEEVGFHAVGSGSAMAQQAGALLAHFRMTERDVDYGVVAAVRVLDTLRDHLTEHRRPDRRLPDHRRGGAHALSEKDIARVRKQVERWAELERRRSTSSSPAEARAVVMWQGVHVTHGSKADAHVPEALVPSLHRAARVEDAVHEFIEPRLRQRGWRDTIVPYTGYGTPSWVRVMARLLLRRPEQRPEAGPTRFVAGAASRRSPSPTRSSSSTWATGSTRCGPIAAATSTSSWRRASNRAGAASGCTESAPSRWRRPCASSPRTCASPSSPTSTTPSW